MGTVVAGAMLVLTMVVLAGCADSPAAGTSSPRPDGAGMGFDVRAWPANTTATSAPVGAEDSPWWSALPRVTIQGEEELGLLLPWGGLHGIQIDLPADANLVAMPHPYEPSSNGEADAVRYGFAVIPAGPTSCSAAPAYAMDVSSDRSGYFSSAFGASSVDLPAGRYVVLAWRWAAKEGEPTEIPGPFRLHFNGGANEVTATTSTGVFADNLPDYVSLVETRSGEADLAWNSALAFVVPSVSMGLDVVESKWSYDLRPGGGCPGQADSGTYTFYAKDDRPSPEPWNGIPLDGLDIAWSFEPPASNPASRSELRLEALLLHGVPRA